MKRRLVTALAGAILVSGCAPEQAAIGKLPPIADAAAAGEVALIRPRAFVGEEFAYDVSVNGVNIAALGSGEHARIKLPAGEHRIAIRCFRALTSAWAETVVTQRVVAGQTAYLAVAPKFECASIEPVSESEGKELLSRTAAESSYPTRAGGQK